MKTAQDLVREAKAKITEISLSEGCKACTNADVVIDVREPAEFFVGHLPSAINIPRGVLEFKISNLNEVTGLNSNIVIYCKTSGRAALAAKSLQAMGYTNVVSIAGGYEGWNEAGLPTVITKDDVNFF